MTIVPIDSTYPYTIEEVAKILRVHRDTVKHYYERDGLVVSRLGQKTIRVIGADIIKFLEACREK